MAAQLEAELVTPPFPLALSYVWQAWARIRRRTPAGFNGPNPITIEAIDAFVRRTGLRLDPRDVELIEAIDDLFLAQTAKQASASDQQQALKDGLASISKGGVRR
ncbi:phage tail assembly chaperone [Pseudaminobacter salicylatoxidans]|uniref:phage tail assembly chaperone n=1 Tax=Pseudaminobacter salicylatoxidans TaxID=93369 RepID=UPI003CC827B1